MAAANYCLRGDLVDDMQATSPADDNRIDRAIVDASRAVDAFCNREPGTFAAQTLTKVFDIVAMTSYRWPVHSARGSSYSSHLWANQLIVPPLITATTVKTDDDRDGVFETTWTANTDYLLWPRNAEVKRRIDRNLDTGRYFFPQGQARVQIVGSWGYLEGGLTPYPIRRATLLLAMNYYRRPSNMANSQGLGGAAIQIGYTDIDVAAILWEVAGRYREVQFGA